MSASTSTTPTAPPSSLASVPKEATVALLALLQYAEAPGTVEEGDIVLDNYVSPLTGVQTPC